MDFLFRFPLILARLEPTYRAIQRFVVTMGPSGESTIKLNEANVLVCAKYRIVALGNHEARNWSKANCYAPVCSQHDVRLIAALACLSYGTLKQGNYKHAFCQSYLLENERLFVKPPANCPLSEPNTYLLLKKTLYGHVETQFIGLTR